MRFGTIACTIVILTARLQGKNLRDRLFDKLHHTLFVHFVREFLLCLLKSIMDLIEGVQGHCHRCWFCNNRGLRNLLCHSCRCFWGLVIFAQKLPHHVVNKTPPPQNLCQNAKKFLEEWQKGHPNTQEHPQPSKASLSDKSPVWNV